MRMKLEFSESYGTWYGVCGKKLLKIMTAQFNAHLKYPKKRRNHNLWMIHRKIEAGPLGNGA